MHTAPDLLGRQVGEPPLDQVQPRPVGGREVHVEPWAFGYPAFDQGRLVRAVVVQDEVDGQPDGHGGVDRVEELSELDGAMTPMELSDDLARLGHRAPRTARSSRGACSRASDARSAPVAWAAAVACGPAPESAPSRRRTARRRARADSGRAPTMSRTFSIRSGSGDNLNVSVRCGLQAERVPDAADRHAAQARRVRHPAQAPVGLAARRGLQGADHPRVRRPRRQSSAAPPGGVHRRDRRAGRGQSGPATSRWFAPACAVSARLRCWPAPRHTAR